MSIWAPAVRRSIVKRAKVGLKSGWIGGALLLPRVLDHEIDELHQMFAEAAHTDALNTRVRPLEQHPEEIGGEIRILETGCLAESYDSLVLAGLVFLNDASRRMFGIRQLGERVSERRAALLHHLELGCRATAPVLKQALGIVRVVGRQIAPFILFARNHAAHPLGDELVLRVEVTVHRHLVGAGGFRDRFDPYPADPMLMKEIAGGGENPVAHGQSRGARAPGFRSLAVNIRFHVRSYPGLTRMLPTGNIVVRAMCYRLVTYYHAARIIATACCPPSRSLAT